MQFFARLTVVFLAHFYFGQKLRAKHKQTDKWYTTCRKCSKTSLFGQSHWRSTGQWLSVKRDTETFSFLMRIWKWLCWCCVVRWYTGLRHVSHAEMKNGIFNSASEIFSVFNKTFCRGDNEFVEEIMSLKFEGPFISPLQSIKVVLSPFRKQLEVWAPASFMRWLVVSRRR